MALQAQRAQDKRQSSELNEAVRFIYIHNQLTREIQCWSSGWQPKSIKRKDKEEARAHSARCELIELKQSLRPTVQTLSVA